MSSSNPNHERPRAIPSHIRELLVCPRCRGAVRDRGDNALHCSACRLEYPVHQGVPWLVPEHARPTGGE